MDNYLGSQGAKQQFNKSDYRRQIEEELQQKSSQSQYHKELYEKEQYIRQLENNVNDLKDFLAEYKKKSDDKDFLIKQRENEIENLNIKIMQLEKKMKYYDDNEMSNQRIINNEVDKEKIKNKEIVDRFNAKFTFFEEQISILENQILDKNKQIVELEIENKDTKYLQDLLDEKKTLIESLRRENQVLIKRIHESQKDNNYGLEKLDLQQEKKFLQDLIKKKESQGLLEELKISNQRYEQPSSEHHKRVQSQENGWRRNQQSSLNNSNQIQSTLAYKPSQNLNERYLQNQQTHIRKNTFSHPTELEKEEIRRNQERMEQLKLKYKYQHQ